jgi:tetratricopeptide (TPR) repeat protein
MLGQSKLMQGEEGYPDLVKAIEINSRSRLGRYFLAKYWRDRGQISISRDYLESLSSEEPREPLWLLELGKTAYAAGDTSRALEYFRSAANLDQENLTSWQSLAEFSLLNGIDLEGTGETAVQRSLLIAPDDPVSNDLMGWLLLSKGDADNALKFLKKSVAADNSSARSRLHLGQAFWGVGDGESAKQEFQAALTLDPNGAVGLTARRLLNQYFPGN